MGKFYIITGNYIAGWFSGKEDEIYALCCAGSSAESEADRPADLLKSYEPYELVHFSGNVYTTRSHNSLKISNGKWMWWSRGIGGRSVLDYLIKSSPKLS